MTRIGVIVPESSAMRYSRALESLYVIVCPRSDPSRSDEILNTHSKRIHSVPAAASVSHDGGFHDNTVICRWKGGAPHSRCGPREYLALQES